jgi:glycolate oxidase FAD binding subunit
MRRLAPFAEGGAPLWRISTAPTNGPKVFNAIRGYMDARAVYDWSGGLLWVDVLPTTDAGAADIRRVIARYGGHATLVRADKAVRQTVETFQPLEPGVLALPQKLKATFDPAGILSPGRMYPGL